MTKSSFKGGLALTLAAFLWGVAFVGQSDAANKISSEAFLFFRFLLGALVLLPVILISDRRRKQGKGFFRRFANPNLLKYSLLCGTLLFCASGMQQLGLVLGTSSGKCAFLTAMYMIFVPIAGMVLGQKPSAVLWIGVSTSIIGMYLLCFVESLSFSVGDLAVLASAVFYAAHILVVDRAANRLDCIRFSCLQFLTAGLLGGAVTCFTSFPPLSAVADAALPILYVGIFSSGVAFTLQIVGQKHCDAAVAPLFMSLESVFAAVAGWLILKESLSVPQIIGCSLIFLAVLLIQLSPLLFHRIKKKI